MVLLPVRCRMMSSMSGGNDEGGPTTSTINCVLCSSVFGTIDNLGFFFPNEISCMPDLVNANVTEDIVC